MPPTPNARGRGRTSTLRPRGQNFRRPIHGKPPAVAACPMAGLRRFQRATPLHPVQTNEASLGSNPQAAIRLPKADRTPCSAPPPLWSKTPPKFLMILHLKWANPSPRVTIVPGKPPMWHPQPPNVPIPHRTSSTPPLRPPSGRGHLPVERSKAMVMPSPSGLENSNVQGIRQGMAPMSTFRRGPPPRSKGNQAEKPNAKMGIWTVGPARMTTLTPPNSRAVPRHLLGPNN